VASLAHTLSPHANRQRQPELEADYNRSTSLGYEPPADVGFIRCLDHGYPTPLARWHCHDEYELHLITATSGKAFVGDWIGPFEPGHVVLCGPRLPHNWISVDIPPEGLAKRDLVIQFQHEPIEQACQTIPELTELLPLLERAKHGIEFFGLSQSSQQHWHEVKASRGLRRLTAFLDFMTDLARWTDYRLLSNVQMQGGDNDAELDQINAIVNRITENVAQSLTAADVAADLGMSESRFSRFFRKATGNTYTADEFGPLHHQYLLRRGLQQRGQFQPPFSGNQGHHAFGVSQAGGEQIWRLFSTKSASSPRLICVNS